MVRGHVKAVAAEVVDAPTVGGPIIQAVLQQMAQREIRAVAQVAQVSISDLVGMFLAEETPEATLLDRVQAVEAVVLGLTPITLNRDI